MTEEVPENYLLVSLSGQQLKCIEQGKVTGQFSVSTARKGPGELKDSECTPRGRHQIRAMIGAGQPVGAVFVGRRPTGEIYHPELAEKFPGRDWILTRILWLSGLEPGKNRLGQVDTMQRYIYLHGTPETNKMGVPDSHGCIRMRHNDLLAVFDWVKPHTEVWIKE